MNSKVWSSMVKEAFDAGLFVRGPSMLPTFDITGDLVLAKRISTRLEKLSRGDVVLIHSPENPRKVVPKRLTGIEGDSITYTVDPKSDKHETVVV